MTLYDFILKLLGAKPVGDHMEIDAANVYECAAHLTEEDIDVFEDIVSKECSGKLTDCVDGVPTLGRAIVSCALELSEFVCGVIDLCNVTVDKTSYLHMPIMYIGGYVLDPHNHIYGMTVRDYLNGLFQWNKTIWARDGSSYCGVIPDSIMPFITDSKGIGPKQFNRLWDKEDTDA